MTKPRDTRTRAIATLLSFLSPGLGQAYAGRSLRGILWALSPVVSIVAASFVVSELSATLFWVVSGGLLAIWIASILDAATVKPSAYRPYSLAAVVAIAAGTVFLTPMMAIGLRVFMLEAFKTPSGSMIPTVVVGDHFFVDKMLFRHRAPRRGEAVVFPYPEHPNQDFVKRVVGLPGDRLEFHGGHPWIDGWEVPHCTVGNWSYLDAEDGATRSGRLEVEFLDGSSFLAFYDASGFGAETQGPWTVKEGEAFVIGDNRNNSHDSRMWYGGEGGGVPIPSIKGKPRFAWMSSKGLTWRDLTIDPVAPSPELKAGLDACLAARPPREKTSPPKRR